MTEAPPEETTPAEGLNDLLLEFTGIIATAMEDICTFSLTVGDSYVPFDPDDDDDTCDEDESYCSQMWTRVVQIAPLDNDESWSGTCAIGYSLTLEVGVLRCVEIPEDGKAPTASAVMEAALQAMDDMHTIQCAAMNSDVWDSITLGTWVPLGPQGGQHGGVWSFTVEFS